MATLPAARLPRKSSISSLVQNLANITQSLRRVVSSRGGQRWQIELEYPPLTRDEAMELWTFLNAQSGRLGAFYFILPNHAPRGTMAGNPVVDGADQVGNTVATTGWPTNSPGVLRIGDFIRLDGHYKTYQVTADVSADAAGNAAVPLFPALHDAPFDGNALVADSRFRCSLMSDVQQVDISILLHYGLKVSLMEVLT